MERHNTHISLPPYMRCAKKWQQTCGTTVKISKKHDAQQVTDILRARITQIMSKQFLELPAVSTQGGAPYLQTQISGWKRSNFTEFHNPIR